jgi:hypothetical protein
LVVLFLQHMFGRRFTKKPIFCTKKMKNGFFMQRKLKLPKSTLFVIPICTHVHNIGSFEQTIPFLHHIFDRWFKKLIFDATLSPANQMIRICIPRISLSNHLNRRATPSNAPHFSEKTQNRSSLSNPSPPHRASWVPIQTLATPLPSPISSPSRRPLPSPLRLFLGSPLRTSDGTVTISETAVLAGRARRRRK